MVSCGTLEVVADSGDGGGGTGGGGDGGTGGGDTTFGRDLPPWVQENKTLIAVGGGILVGSILLGGR